MFYILGFFGLAAGVYCVYALVRRGQTSVPASGLTALLFCSAAATNGVEGMALTSAAWILGGLFIIVSTVSVFNTKEEESKK